MTDLPFESHIRTFMYKINDEIDKVENEINTIKSTDPKLDDYYKWLAALNKLSASCTSATSVNISFRRKTNKN